MYRSVTDEVDGCYQEEAEIGEDVPLDVQYTGVVPAVTRLSHQDWPGTSLARFSPVEQSGHQVASEDARHN